MVGTGPSDSFYLPLSVKSYQASVALTSFLPLTSVIHFSKFLPEAAISRCFWRGMKSADWLGQVSQWNSTLRVNEFHEDECPWQEQWQGSMGVGGACGLCEAWQTLIPISSSKDFVEHKKEWRSRDWEMARLADEIILSLSPHAVSSPGLQLPATLPKQREAFK